MVFRAGWLFWLSCWLLVSFRTWLLKWEVLITHLPFLLQIIDENGSVLPPGNEGDIAIKMDAKQPFTFFTRYLLSQKWISGEPVQACSMVCIYTNRSRCNTKELWLFLTWQCSDLRNFHSLPHSSADLLCHLQFYICPCDKFSPLEEASTSSYIPETENKQWKILWVVSKEAKLMPKLKASQYLEYLIVACSTGWSSENCFHNLRELLYHWRQREHGWGWIHTVYGEIWWCHHLLWVCRFQLKCQEMSKK